MGVDVIELDVHRTKDGKFVVIHDDTVDRTTNGKGKINNLTFAEIQALDAGRGERIPTLDEVLETVAGRVPVDIEIKGEGLSRAVTEILSSRLLHGANPEDFIISSFSKREIVRVGESINLRRVLLVKHFLGLSVRAALRLHLWGVGVKASLVERRFVEQAHEKGLKFLVWTVDTRAAIEKFKSMGVDGIFSNFPDRLR